MSTKSAPWSKWPSRWLKTLPNTELAGTKEGLRDFETGPLAPMGKASPERSKPSAGAILRFEDFVERPLRSSSQKKAAMGRGRTIGEASRGNGGDDGDGHPGA
jgi:hypothetical protein